MINRKLLVLIIILVIISSLYLTSCCYRLLTIDRSSKDEETVDVEEFSGIPNSYLVSKLKVPGQAIDVNISGNYAYLTNDLGVLYVIDIKDKEIIIVKDGSTLIFSGLLKEV